MIHTFTGANTFQLQRQLHRHTDDFIRQYTDLGLEKLDGEESEYDRLRESLQSLPFLASRKLVVLRRPGAVKQFADNIAELLPTIPDSTDVIIVEPKLDKRSGYYKALKSRTEYHEFADQDAHATAQWLAGEAKEAGGSLSLADAAYLIDRVGLDQQLLDSELKKLLLYKPHITRETIDDLTERAPQSTIFQLVESAFGGDVRRALALYEEQRRQKIEPLAIIGMLTWQLHVLALVKTAGDRAVDDIARQAKLNPYVVRKSQQVSRRLTPSDLKRLVAMTLQTDVALKSESIDEDEAMSQLLMEYAAI